MKSGKMELWRPPGAPFITIIASLSNAPESATGSGRSASAAAARLAVSPACTTASSSSKVPGSRAARQSGNRLNVVWLCGHYQRATRVARGILRAQVPWRASEHRPCGCSPLPTAKLGGLAIPSQGRDDRTVTIVMPLRFSIGSSCAEIVSSGTHLVRCLGTQSRRR